MFVSYRAALARQFFSETRLGCAIAMGFVTQTPIEVTSHSARPASMNSRQKQRKLETGTLQTDPA